MKIAIAGGQTGGPIVPLLAVAAEIKKDRPRTQVLVLDTPHSTARMLAEKGKLRFQVVRAGKLRRYRSWRNLVAPFALAFGFFQSLGALYRFKPNIVMGAGGFVEVPVVWAAWLLRIPVLLHQQDVMPSLSNSLSAPFANKITTTFERSQRDFHSGSGFFGSRRNKKQPVIWTGNPFREALRHGTKEGARKHFGLEGKLPVLLVMGGGSGAQGINHLLYKALPRLSKAVQIIHATGVKKKHPIKASNYRSYEFIDRMDLAYAVSDIVVSRAGVSTLTELSNLAKVSIIIPMPFTHQEVNAQLLYEKQAAIVLDQNLTSPERMAWVIRQLLLDWETQKLIQKNISLLMPKRSAATIAKLALEITDHGK